MQARSGGACFINDPGDPKAGPFGGLRPGRILAALDNESAPNHPAERMSAVVAPKPWWFPYIERKS